MALVGLMERTGGARIIHTQKMGRVCEVRERGTSKAHFVSPGTGTHILRGSKRSPADIQNERKGGGGQCDARVKRLLHFTGNCVVPRRPRVAILHGAGDPLTRFGVFFEEARGEIFGIEYVLDHAPQSNDARGWEVFNPFCIQKVHLKINRLVAIN